MKPMKLRIQIALMSVLISIGAHFYLTSHYYPLKFGYSTGNSVCNLSGKINCDAVAASEYAAFFEIPVSVWGLAFNAVLFMMILLSYLEWSENPERLRRWTFLMVAMSLAGSVLMGAISIFLMSVYCIVCIGLYDLSIISFVAYKGVLKEPFFMHLKRDLSVMWTESRGILVALVSIPVLAFLTHQFFMQNLGNAQVARMVTESVEEWEHSPPQDFVAKPAITMGPEKDKATITLVEFADFRCPHCKRASYTLHAFVKAHPDVRFEFYAFPLDGQCNEKIGQSNGISCRLAAAVYCAEREGKGWEMHDMLFDKQEEIAPLQTPAELDTSLSKNVTPLGLNFETLQRCLDQPETMDAIRAMAKQGGLVNVMGTPTLFANGKLLSRGQLVPVLQAVHARAKQSKAM
jgi:protein-disulfide isomerase/uncharacterized membrane protein